MCLRVGRASGQLVRSPGERVGVQGAGRGCRSLSSEAAQPSAQPWLALRLLLLPVGPDNPHYHIFFREALRPGVRHGAVGAGPGRLTQLPAAAASGLSEEAGRDTEGPPQVGRATRVSPCFLNAHVCVEATEEPLSPLSSMVHIPRSPSEFSPAGAATRKLFFFFSGFLSCQLK